MSLIPEDLYQNIKTNNCKEYFMDAYPSTLDKNGCQAYWD